MEAPTTAAAAATTALPIPVTITTEEGGLKHVHYELLDGGTLDYFPGFLNKEQADALWELCRRREDDAESVDASEKQKCIIPWKQDMVYTRYQHSLLPSFFVFLSFNRLRTYR